MAVGRVDDDGIGTGIHQCLGALQRVGGHAHTCCHAQPALLILAGHGLVLGLCNVLIGDQSHQSAFLVDDGQFLNLVLLQNLGGSLQVGLLMGGDEILTGHHLVNLLVKAALEAQVAVGDDAHEAVVLVDHGNAADVVVGHDGKSLGNGAAATNRHRIVDHAVLGTLHDSHLAGLSLYRHVLVNHADTAFTGDGNGHCRFRHGIHSSRHKRDVQFYVPRETCFQLYCLGQHFRISGNKQNVVKGESVHHDFVFYKRCHISYLFLLRCKISNKNPH